MTDNLRHAPELTNDLKDQIGAIVGETCHKAISQTLAEQINGTLTETIERLMAPAAELEAIKRKSYLTEREVALMFSIAPATLRTERSRGLGPRYMKDGRKILYLMDDLVIYYKNRLIQTRG